MTRLSIALILGFGALILVFVWLFTVMVQPAPPYTVVLSSGPGDGAYHAFALRYREHLLVRYGVNLVVKESSGSLENLERLKERREGAQVALVQGGLATAAEAPGIMTLGSLFYEPVWVFVRGDAPLTAAAQLRGKRIAIGPEGSGVRALALRILRASGINENTARLDPSGGLEAAQKLEAGALDVAVFVNAPEALAIQRLLHAKGISLASSVRADAYARQLPFLDKLVLPAGSLDLVGDLPSKDLTLLTATANLLATDDLHPVIIDLLLEAARAVHGGGSLLNRPGEFPALRDREFPASADAERIYRGHYSLLLRQYVPFWLAVWIERFALFAIPVLLVGILLLRYVPAAYRWQARRHVYRWYGELKFIEFALRTADGDLLRHRDQLEEIEEQVNALRLPLAYSSEYYTLRAHIGLVRKLLDERRAEIGSAASGLQGERA